MGPPYTQFATVETIISSMEKYWGLWCPQNPPLMQRSVGPTSCSRAYSLSGRRDSKQTIARPWGLQERSGHSFLCGTQRKECLSVEDPGRLCKRGVLWEPWRARYSLTGKEDNGFLGRKEVHVGIRCKKAWCARELWVSLVKLKQTMLILQMFALFFIFNISKKMFFTLQVEPYTFLESTWFMAHLF